MTSKGKVNVRGSMSVVAPDRATSSVQQRRVLLNERQLWRLEEGEPMLWLVRWRDGVGSEQIVENALTPSKTSTKNAKKKSTSATSQSAERGQIQNNDKEEEFANLRFLL
jgi:hypothetical protein